MRFDILYRSSRKIIVGEIISLIALVLLGMPSSVFVLFTSAAEYMELERVVWYIVFSQVFKLLELLFCMIGTTIVAIGLIQARKEEVKFIEGIVVICVYALLGIASLFVSSDMLNILSVIFSLFDLWIIVTVIQGFVNIFEKCDEYHLADKGIKSLKIVVATFSVSVISSIAFEFFKSNPSFIKVGVLITILIAILQIIGYVFYLRFIFRSKRMLSNRHKLQNSERETEG